MEAWFQVVAVLVTLRHLQMLIVQLVDSFFCLFFRKISRVLNVGPGTSGLLVNIVPDFPSLVQLLTTQFCISNLLV